MAATAPGPRVLDAAVGQISGQPVFADDLLADLDAQLAALGRRLDAATFRTRASELIRSSLDERLVTTLILGEAERGLTEQEQGGIRYMVSERREELLRRNGRGSLAVARKNLLEETGLTLDETLRQYREGVVTKLHFDRNVVARINVARRDIERYYRENLDTFQPTATRDLGLIWVDDAATAAGVAARLDAGEPFAAVAEDPATGNAWAGGAMTSIVGDRPFGRPAVDEAVAGLDREGQWKGPIAQPGPDDSGERFWFVEAKRVDRPESRDLIDAQADIEKTLRERQFLRLRARFIERLMREGSHTPLKEMEDAILQIAVNRYGRR